MEGLIDEIIRVSHLVNRKIAAFFLILFVSVVFGQKGFSIEGKITDSETGGPLPFVNVYFSQTTIGSSTDQNGYYQIKNIPAGNYQLVASMIGYKPIIREITLKEIKNLSIDFRLIKKPYTLNQVEVKGKFPDCFFSSIQVLKCRRDIISVLQIITVQ